MKKSEITKHLDEMIEAAEKNFTADNSQFVVTKEVQEMVGPEYKGYQIVWLLEMIPGKVWLKKKTDHPIIT